MELRGRNLSRRMRGEDVKLLQRELRELGFSIKDKDGYFGKTTQRSVLEFQRQHKLKATGKVNQRTAAMIGLEVETRHKQSGAPAVDSLTAPQPELPDLTTVAATLSSATSERAAPALTDLAASLRLDLPQPLLSALAERGIHTLSDILETGGIRHIEGLPVRVDNPAMRTLEAHANLSPLSADLGVRAALIEKGYPSLSAIANASRTDVVAALHDQVGDVKAAQLYETARAQVGFLNNVLAGMLADRANGFTTPAPIPLPFPLSGPTPPDSCECKDCESALSPLAYLADLLDYATKHLKNSLAPGAPITLDLLANAFHQPFGDLPASCELVEKQVHQVRICIEVLRGYLDANSPTSNERTTLDRAEAAYGLAAYQALLNKIGTSYEEIRLARAWSRDPKNETDREKLKQLADRLGVDLEKSPPADAIDRLLLLPEAAPNTPLALTEQALERLFGLADTTRDPLSGGATLGDSQGQIKRWNLNGVDWNSNTDPDGTVYVNLKKLLDTTTGAVTFSVELFRDPQRTTPVAAGSRSTAAGTVDVSEENASGLSGRLDIAYTANSTDIELVAIPNFLSWRLKHLRTLWQGEDWPADPYSDGTLLRIDADIIGPDDFRRPRRGQEPFNLWFTRRQFMDQTLANLQATREDPTSSGLDAILQQVLGNPLPDLDGLLADLTRGNNPQQALQRIQDLHLTVDSFTRLMEIRARDRDAARDSRNAKVEEAEWREVYSILAQAEKQKLFARWHRDEQAIFVCRWDKVPGDDTERLLKSLGEFRLSWLGTARITRSSDDQTRTLAPTVGPSNKSLSIKLDTARTSADVIIEDGAESKQIPSFFVAKTVNGHLTLYIQGVELGPDHFWPSIREPRVGDWPPPARPLVDPDLVALEGLPEHATSGAAVALWGTRQAELVKINNDLRSARESNQPNGFDVMLKRALGDPLPVDLNDLRNALNSPDKTIVERAKTQVQRDLHMTPDDFFRLMAVKDADAESDLLKKPTESEYTGVYTILTQAEKVRVSYPTWKDAEQRQGLDYWSALKARLPRWRATPEARQAWRQALHGYSEPSNLDPDLVTLGDLKEQTAGAAFDLWKTRAAWLQERYDELKRVRETATTSPPTAGLDAILRRSLGVSLSDLVALDEDRKRGQSIQARLDQLRLSSAAFSYLVRIVSLLAANAPVLDSEWSDGYHILVEVLKRCAFARWRDEEQERTITLGPDHFQIAVQDRSRFRPADPVPLQPWRATLDARRAWHDTLQARIDQQRAVVDAMNEAVRMTEEAVLPMLRDALVIATDADGSGLDAKAKWLGDRLFLDTRDNGCQITTRIAQAIETLQGMLFATRTGQLPPEITFWALPSALKRSWTHIVSGKFGGGYGDLLCYDADSGDLEFYSTNIQGDMILLKRLPRWKRGWTHVIADYLAVGTTQINVLFYNSETRSSELYFVAGQGNLYLTQGQPTWNIGWTHLATGRFGGGGTDLVCYNQDRQVLEFDTIDSRGFNRQLAQPIVWRQNWTHVVPGQFGGDAYTDLFFYNQTVGQGEFYTSDGQGGLSSLNQVGWRTTSVQIVPGQFGGDAYTDLLFYGPDAGDAEFYSTDGQGNLSLLRQVAWDNRWTLILANLWGRTPADLLLYDRAANMGQLYARLQLELDAPDFDEDWRWMGSYATWRAAMLVFLYPENILLPSLRPQQTPAFRKLVSELRSNGRLTPDQARQAARVYADYFRDVCLLKLEACVSWPLFDRFYQVYLFSRSPYSNKVYWSRIVSYPAPLSSPEIESQGFWDEIPGFQKVISLVGAVVYAPPSQSRFVYLFARTDENGVQKLVFTKYDLDKSVWNQEPTVLELPDKATHFRAHLKPTLENKPPLVGLELPNGVRYLRSLGIEGGDWEAKDFRRIFLQGSWGHLSQLQGHPFGADFDCTDIHVSDWPAKFAVTGDFDGDGRAEVAVAPYPFDRLGAPNPDLQDTKADDLWVMDYDPNASRWGHLRTPNDPLTADADFRGDSAANLAVVGDFDGDGRDEIAVTPAFPGYYLFSKNHFWAMKFNQSISTWTGLSDFDGSSNPKDQVKFAIAGDFDGNGRDEIAIAPPASGGASAKTHFRVVGYDLGILPWKQLGDFDYGIPTDKAGSPVVGDFDGDGRDEIAIARSASNEFWVMDFEPVTGSWGHLGAEDPKWLDFDCSSKPYPAKFALVGDFDGDGQDEILAVGLQYFSDGHYVNHFWVMHYDLDTDLWVHLSNPNDPNAVDFTVDQKYAANFAVAGDFDGDGEAEVAIALDVGFVRGSTLVRDPSGGNHFWVMDYDPASRRWRHFPDFSGSKAKPYPPNGRTAVAGDFDGDGLAEIAFAPYLIAVDFFGKVILDVNGNESPSRDSAGNDFWVMNFDVIPEGWQGPCDYSDIKPVYSGSFEITDRLSADDLGHLHDRIYGAFEANKLASETNRAYLQEAWYFVPMQIGLQLQQSGEYTAALDWFRTLYDYRTNRRVYYGLELEGSIGTYDRGAYWLQDLNPHTVAGPHPWPGASPKRAYPYTRFTLMYLVRCLLDFADAEFTRDTVESVPRARILYTTALDLLDLPVLRQNLNKCDEQILVLDRELSSQLAVDGTEWLPVWRGLRDRVAAAPGSGALATAIGDIRDAVAGNGAWEGRFARLRDIVVNAEAPKSPVLADLLTGRAEARGQWHTALLAQPEIATTTGEIGTDIAALYPEALNSLGAYVPILTYDFCIQPNAVLSALRLHAELNLYKLRSCRNIAGLLRQLDPYAAPADGGGSAPSLGTDGRLALPGTVTLQPTQYRYAALAERAKQLVGLAQQMEAAFLSALERRDDQAYTLLKARQDIRLTHAGVQLRGLQLTEARGGVTLAELQRDKARIEVKQYQDWLGEGLSAYEEASLILMAVSAYLQTVAAIAEFANLKDGPGRGLAALAGAASTAASMLANYAAYERRAQDWEFRRNLAQQDVLIGNQQVTNALAHVRVAGQERTIAEMQAEHAEATVDFLANKFTNVELFDWMSRVLEGVYRFFLQHATAAAKLAENQLAFERHEVISPIIQADYWEAPSENGAGNTDGRAPDRRGLTGSARLLQDIYQLDQRAFETNKRKLQLTKTISLARMAPFEFQRFRETGVLPFATPMELFDHDFPGHYLRLIRRLRTFVVALIPPTQGIRATLSTTTGTSRVVIDGDGFQTTVMNRPAESVALSSPRDATGLFELDTQPEMLFPFEGIGVDTTWQLSMPKAANLFDYSAIADVLITIEYTALNDSDYRQQVIQGLNSNMSATRPFSFRHQFADAWYDLHNPELVEEPDKQMVVRFSTRRDDFPPNVDDLKIQHVVVYFAHADGHAFEGPVTVTYLRFTEQGSSGFVGGGATSIDGVISTRRGNAGSWTSMIGKAPAGEWELALPNTEEMKGRFKREEIEDILFVITYAGRAPEWPV